MNDPILPLPGLSPAGGKPVVVKFDGGLLSSDGGVLALREVERRLRVADRLAACVVDPRAPEQITHSLADIIRFRLLMISAGYEDGNDASHLRGDPAFKMAMDLTPSERELCSQSTISRLENLPDVRALLRMGRAMVDLYCASFREVPKRITLDLDDTFDAVHGGQQLRLFNAHYDEYGFQPIVVFDGAGRFVTAVLAPPNGPAARRSLPAPAAARHPRQLAAHRKSCCAPTALLQPRGSRLVSRQPHRLHPRRCADLDLAAARRNPRGRREGALRGCAARRQGPPFQEFRRRPELEPRRADHRPRRSRRGRPRCAFRRRRSEQTQLSRALRGSSVRRGQAGTTVKSFKAHLAANHSLLHQGHHQSASAVPARRRLWLMWGLRESMPKRSMSARRPVRHLRLRLIKVAARVVEMKTIIRVHLPTSCRPRISCASPSNASLARHLRTGRQKPRTSNPVPSTRKTLPPRIRPQAGAGAARPQPSKIQGNRRDPARGWPIHQSDA